MRFLCYPRALYPRVSFREREREEINRHYARVISFSSSISLLQQQCHSFRFPMILRPSQATYLVSGSIVTQSMKIINSSIPSEPFAAVQCYLSGFLPSFAASHRRRRSSLRLLLVAARWISSSVRETRRKPVVSRRTLLSLQFLGCFLCLFVSQETR